MIMKLFKGLVQGLLLAACFGGGYYWSLSLKPEFANGDMPGLGDLGSELRDAGEFVVAQVDEVLSPPKEAEAVEVVDVPAVVAAPKTVDSPPESLSVAMRNNLDALRTLGR